MVRNDAGSRFSSMTGSSTDSARSSITVKPLPSTPALPQPPPHVLRAASSASSRRAAPARLKTDDTGNLIRSVKEVEPPVSPTSVSGSRLALSPSSTNSAASLREGQHRMSDFGNYRRDLAILDPAGTRAPPNQQTNPATGSLSNVAPWMSASGGLAGSTTFYNDSTDNLSLGSQLSPGLRAAAGRPSQTTTGSNESPDAAYFTDERRPSVASITTNASSQGSRASGARGGLRKLQGFFGEEFPGRDSSESSLTHTAGGGKDRSHSYSHGRPHRDRNYSNATDHGRDASPSSRPRTPVPAPEVVPFLYQEADDIARYGEAPVRDILSGPDRDRYKSEASVQNPPKTSSSGRSGHSLVHLSGHSHRHNKSNDDPRALRPSISREDSTAGSLKDRNNSTAMFGPRSRAQSPTPSGNGTIYGPKNGSSDGQSSPGPVRKGFLGRLRVKHRDKDDSEPGSLKKLTGSSHSLQTRPSRQELPRVEGLPPANEWPGPALPYQDVRDAYGLRPGYQRGTTFNNKFPFSKKGRSNRHHDDIDEHIGPTDRQDGDPGGKVWYLDTNLSNMDGIVGRPLPLTPMEPDFTKNKNAEPEKLLPAKPGAPGPLGPPGPPGAPGAPALGFGVNGVWNAPDSWAVRGKGGDETAAHVPETDDIGSPPKPDEKKKPYCIRVFRSDGTFATLQLPLETTVTEVISQIVKKSYVTDGLDNYHIILRKHDLVRVLSAAERPLLMQKRLLQQVGYEERDRIEDIGREDNSYLCRFLFLSARESDFHAITHDLGLSRMQKFSHVDLSGRNLITIPVPLYSKASDIISLNLSRNLSLDLPRDFIQSCTMLRDVKFNNNEVRKLPLSLSRATRLTYLDISNNRIDQLQNPGMAELAGLLKLNLANNRLTSLERYFGAFVSLRTLNLSSNFLKTLPDFIGDLRSLVDLDLSFNGIDNIPDSIGRLKALERFAITNNRISGALPLAVRNLSSLRELDIKYNNITSIDVISELPKLEILSAEHNNVSQFAGTFERIRSIKLNSNPITKFEIKAPIPTLKVLNLSHCQLASIDESFNNMLSLERLVLDKNYFVSLPNRIGNLKRLEHFSIAHNSVGELPVEFGCLTELRVLDVRGNNIRKLPMELWWANKLETLNASSNVLENFPKPASRAPQAPGESSSMNNSLNGRSAPTGALSQTPSAEELSILSLDASRRPSQASSTLLSVGPSPVPSGPDRKSSMISIYGKGGRNTSVVSRSTTQSNGTNGGMVTPMTARKDSGLSQRLTNTFAGSLRNLYLADNQLDDDVFDQITLLSEVRILNLSYNDISDMPQRSIKSWPQLVELYLSGNELTSLPADDLEEYSLLQTLHINSNKFTNLPADISRAKKLAVLDCGSNYLKYNIANVPYDWNWNLNPNLRFLNLSGNRKLEIKQIFPASAAQNREQYTDFNRLNNLRVLGLMDVTLTQPSIPDQSEDRRVRTSGSLAGHLPYGMADTLGKNEHLSTIDLVVPRFNSIETDTLLGLFDGQALSSGGSKIAKYLHENFGHILSMELKTLKHNSDETPEDALRRAFLTLNKDLVTVAIQHTEERPLMSHRGSSAPPVVLSKEDLSSGGVATVVYIKSQELYVANVGDAQAMLIQSDGAHKMLTKKHDPADPHERSRIRDAGGWVSRNGKLNDSLEVSRAFGYLDLMPAVQAAPYVSHHTIKEQDDCVLIATKELWQYLAPGLVVDIARSVHGDLMRASQKLRDIAMAYGASGKIMVMMISVSDLKRRMERSRLGRGQSMSLFSLPQDESSVQNQIRRNKRAKADGPLDSVLSRLEAEVPAPTGMIAIVFTDIKNSTQLWETYPEAMRSAIKLHNEVMRRQLRRIGGFEVKTEGDAFMVSFPTATSALLWCFAVQTTLLTIEWPSEMLNSLNCQPTFDRDERLIFRGLSVRMGIHWGEPLAEPDPVTRRMDYYGPMVNKASRISAVADGGQIAVSSDFISEIQRCLETYQELPGATEEGMDEDGFAKAIRQELRSLSSQGFEVKDMGEKKLKGLENPEFVYSVYPQPLAGRIEQHTAHERAQNNGGFVQDKPAMLSPGSELLVNPEDIWALWGVALRLERLCGALEEFGGRGLQPPETELLERMKQRGGEVTESFLYNFMEHLVSRVEAGISALAIRHIAIGSGPISHLNDLRAPMATVLSGVAAQLAELQRYKARFGELEDGISGAEEDAPESDDDDDDDSEDGSDTEQE